MKGPWDERPYHSLDWELKRLYRKKLYKLSLNGGMSCPNRDGSKGTGGCIFCSGGGSGEFASGAALSVKDGRRLAADRVAHRVLPAGGPAQRGHLTQKHSVSSQPRRIAQTASHSRCA